MVKTMIIYRRLVIFQFKKMLRLLKVLSGNKKGDKMKKLILVLCLLIIGFVPTKEIWAETYPDAISYIKVSAFDSSNQNYKLADVLIGVFTTEGEALGTYRTNSEGEVLIEVTPGMLELKVLQSTDGYEVAQEYQVMTLDATAIDFYEVEFPHQLIETVDHHVAPTMARYPFYSMSTIGVGLACVGVSIIRKLSREEL